MQDNLSHLRGLPKSILKVLPKLIVNRKGTDANAVMQTKDIIAYINPHEPYELTQSGLAQRTDVSKRVRVSTVKMSAKQVPPKHVCIDGHWDKEEYIKETDANILGGLGTFTLKGKGQIEIPVLTADPFSLAFYGSRLIPIGDTVVFESEKVLPLTVMNTGETYINQYLMLADYGHGAYIEYHEQPHFWMPTSPDSRGFVILGREMNGKYFLTGFKIPFGYGLYTSGYVLHADSFLIGEYLVVYTLAADYSTVILKDAAGHLVPFVPVEYSDTGMNDPMVIALREAIQKGQLEILKQLLQDPFMQTKIAAADNIALREAAAQGHLAVLDYLLSFAAVCDQITAFQNGALALSSKNGHLQIVNRLLEFAAVQKEITAAENKALTWAAANGHVAIVKRLLQFEAVHQTVADNDNEIFREAVKNGHLEIAEILLHYPAVQAQIAVFDNEALKVAMETGNLALVNQLLKYDAVQAQIAQNAADQELLWIAKNQHLDILNRLLEVDAISQNMHILDNELLRAIAAKGYVEIVDRLLQLEWVQQNVAACYNEALREAAKQGHLAIVNRLLEYQSVQDAVAACDNEALRQAAGNGHLAIVARLLQFDEVQHNVAACYNEAFQLAVINGHQDVMERLLQCPVVRSFEDKYQFRKKWAFLSRGSNTQPKLE